MKNSCKCHMTFADYLNGCSFFYKDFSVVFIHNFLIFCDDFFTAEGYLEDKCIINESNACGFAVFVGVLAFLGGVGLLVLEAKFESISSIKIRRRAVIADLAFTGVWAAFWFVAFCYLVNQWSKTEEEELPAGYGVSNAKAAIAFSLFSVPVWGALAYFSYLALSAGRGQRLRPIGIRGWGGRRRWDAAWRSRWL